MYVSIVLITKLTNYNKVITITITITTKHLDIQHLKQIKAKQNNIIFYNKTTSIIYT